MQFRRLIQISQKRLDFMCPVFVWSHKVQMSSTATTLDMSILHGSVPMFQFSSASSASFPFVCIPRAADDNPDTWSPTQVGDLNRIPDLALPLSSTKCYEFLRSKSPDRRTICLFSVSLLSNKLNTFFKKLSNAKTHRNKTTKNHKSKWKKL